MCEHDQLPLQIFMEIVQYMRRQQEQGIKNNSGQAALIRSITELAGKTSSGVSIQSLSNGVTIHAPETVMNDKYEIGQAGTAGPDSSSHNFTQAWDEQKSQLDLDVLSRQLGEVCDKGRATGVAQEEYVALAELFLAELAAKRGDGPGVLGHLARAGAWALGIAVAIDARAVIEAFSVIIEDRSGQSKRITNGNHSNSTGGAIMRDQYSVNQAAAVGPGATVHHVSFAQIRGDSDIDLQALGDQLATLRAAMRNAASEPAHDIAVAEIASAEIEAAQGDDLAMLKHLARAGRWASGIASAIGASLAAEVIKKAAGI